MATNKNTKSDEESIMAKIAAARARGNAQGTLAFAPAEMVVTDTTDIRPALTKPVKTAKPLPVVIASKPNAKPLTQREERLVKTAAEIASEHPDDDDRVKWTPLSRQFFSQFKLVPFSSQLHGVAPVFVLVFGFPFFKFKWLFGKRSASGRRQTLVGKHGWELWGCGQAGRFASLSTCP